MAEQMIIKKSYTLAVGEEVNTGWYSYGVYAIRTTSNGQIAIFTIGAYPESTGILGDANTFTGDYESTSSKLFVGRKVKNDAIFIKNISTITRVVDIVKIFSF